MFTLHQPEREFWRTMNPARFMRLYNAYLPQEGKIRPNSGPQQTESLFDYMRRGGG